MAASPTKSAVMTPSVGDDTDDSVGSCGSATSFMS
mgnify:CR=1 FL=1